jgi:hypothetical protein
MSTTHSERITLDHWSGQIINGVIETTVSTDGAFVAIHQTFKPHDGHPSVTVLILAQSDIDRLASALNTARAYPGYRC